MLHLRPVESPLGILKESLEMLMAVSSNPIRLTQEDLESIIERALEEARARGASQAEAAVSQDTGLSVGVRLGEV